jgi:hypothetical protein
LCARFSKRVDAGILAALEAALEQRNTTQTADPVGNPYSALNLAQRTIALDRLMSTFADARASDLAEMRQQLAALQQADGLWDAGALYGYGPLPFFMGSRELTTAFALAALGGAASSA